MPISKHSFYYALAWAVFAFFLPPCLGDWTLGQPVAIVITLENEAGAIRTEVAGREEYTRLQP